MVRATGFPLAKPLDGLGDASALGSFRTVADFTFFGQAVLFDVPEAFRAHAFKKPINDPTGCFGKVGAFGQVVFLKTGDMILPIIALIVSHRVCKLQQIPPIAFDPVFCLTRFKF